MSNNELKHYGIPGMKWGVRRAQRKLAKLTGRDAKDVSEKEAKQFRRDVKYLKTMKDGNGWIVDSPGERAERFAARSRLYVQMQKKKGEAYTQAVFKSARMKSPASQIINASADIGYRALNNIFNKTRNK
jgi:hypothetical protein